MSAPKVQRYTYTPLGMVPTLDGPYVRARDIDKIVERAEVRQRLELDAVATLLDVFDAPKVGMLQSLLTCLAYVEQLRAQVEDARRVEAIDDRRHP